MQPTKQFKALLFNIQRFSTEDGPGIRTTLFFKGCPLTCPWCHNPEGRFKERTVVWYDARCIGCLDCLEGCPNNAIIHGEQRMQLANDRCTRCGTCVEICPGAAREIIGHEYSLDELCREALKDSTFYAKSGGGVTFSGGEPLSQASFIIELAKQLKSHEIHLALDTTGFGKENALRELLTLVDLVLLDVKIMEADRHLELTDIPLSKVLRAIELISDTGKPLWVRTPVIPGMTDSDDNIQAIAEYLAAHAPTLERYDLLAFENTCRAKYEMLGMTYEFAGKPLIQRSRMEALTVIAKDAGLTCARWSGPVND